MSFMFLSHVLVTQKTGGMKGLPEKFVFMMNLPMIFPITNSVEIPLLGIKVILQSLGFL